MLDGFAFSLMGVAAAAALVAWACYAHHQWQQRVERERVVLSMKKAATPGLMAPEERDRLELLREPWWAVWRWLPEQLGYSTRSRSHRA